jgi:transposase
MSDTELMDRSEPVRRLEIFTGTGRRRAWSAEQKAEIVAESLSVGSSVSAATRPDGAAAVQVATAGTQRRCGAP